MDGEVANEPANVESDWGAGRAPSSRNAVALYCAGHNTCTAPCGLAQHASATVFSITQQARHAGGAMLNNKLTSIAMATAQRMASF
jgi:hypothetical protein